MSAKPCAMLLVASFAGADEVVDRCWAAIGGRDRVVVGVHCVEGDGPLAPSAAAVVALPDLAADALRDSA